MPPPSATYQRLRAYIAKQMRMSPIDQPLMLMELLVRSSPSPAQDVARRILGSAWWARFTFNGITAYGNGVYSLIGGDELSDAERDALQQLCRQRLDAFREHPDQRLGDVQGAHPCQGPLRVCGAHEQQRALEVDHIIPKNQGGSDAISNLQARWRAAAGCCW